MWWWFVCANRVIVGFLRSRREETQHAGEETHDAIGIRMDDRVRNLVCDRGDGVGT